MCVWRGEEASSFWGFAGRGCSQIGPLVVCVTSWLGLLPTKTQGTVDHRAYKPWLEPDAKNTNCKNKVARPSGGFGVERGGVVLLVLRLSIGGMWGKWSLRI
jgi:hypothetical protein